MKNNLCLYFFNTKVLRYKLNVQINNVSKLAKNVPFVLAIGTQISKKLFFLHQNIFRLNQK